MKPWCTEARSLIAKAEELYKTAYQRKMEMSTRIGIVTSEEQEAYILMKAQAAQLMMKAYKLELANRGLTL